MPNLNKISGLDVKAVAEAGNLNLYTVYRWRRQVINGDGINDDAKVALIQASEVCCADPLTWDDFTPDALRVAS